jgi:hypothetical protein
MKEGHDPHGDLLLLCQPKPGNQARAEVDHSSVDSGQTGVRVEHHRSPARCWRATSWYGRPRKTSEGKYRRGLVGG